MTGLERITIKSLGWEIYLFILLFFFFAYYFRRAFVCVRLSVHLNGRGGQVPLCARKSFASTILIKYCGRINNLLSSEDPYQTTPSAPCANLFY